MSSRLVSRYRCLLDPLVASFACLSWKFFAIIKSLCLGLASRVTKSIGVRCSLLLSLASLHFQTCQKQPRSTREPATWRHSRCSTIMESQPQASVPHEKHTVHYITWQPLIGEAHNWRSLLLWVVLPNGTVDPLITPSSRTCQKHLLRNSAHFVFCFKNVPYLLVLLV